MAGLKGRGRVEEVAEKLMDGGVHREDMRMDGFEPFCQRLRFRT